MSKINPEEKRVFEEMDSELEKMKEKTEDTFD